MQGGSGRDGFPAMTPGGLGPQGRRSLKLAASGGVVPLPIEQPESVQPEAEPVEQPKVGNPKGDADSWVRAAWARRYHEQMAELAYLRDRVLELEHELRRAEASEDRVRAAYEAGKRDGARTRGLPSIFSR